MRHATNLLLTALLLLAISVAATAEPMTYDGAYDIGELLDEAKFTYDFENEDAVFLVYEEKSRLLPDNRRVYTYHHVVYITTEEGIELYGDLRVPFDSERQTLTSHSHRTWMDEQWWPSDPPGFVETLPYEVDHAYDYANLRETMMLHEGIELPCILESAYTIEDKEPYRKGMDGVFIVPQDDPAVVVNFEIGMPDGRVPAYNQSEGLNPPQELKDAESGLNLYTWTARLVDGLARPITDDPASYAPAITWSTYASWDDFGMVIREAFDEHRVLSDDMKDSLQAVTRTCPTLEARAMRVLELVERHNTYVDYYDRFLWANARNADRIWNTGYGHRVDRAILAAALFEEAGLIVWPAYLGLGYGSVDDGAATTGRMDGFGVWVSGGDTEVEAYYDPVTNTLANGFATIFARSVWAPGHRNSPDVYWTGKGDPSDFDLRMRLDYCAKENRWHGRGYFAGDGAFCPYHKMEGVHRDGSKHLEKIVGGALSGAELTRWNPTVFDRFHVQTGISMQADAGERDAHDRIRLEVGEPRYGLLDMLPDDVHLYQEVRQSPVMLAGQLQQSVAVNVNAGSLERVHVPEPVKISNDAGTFDLVVKEMGDRIVVKRSIHLLKAEYSASEWPALRALLLAEQDARYRTLYFK
ncbi:DUF3857 domain-containing protein [bacterium]|nr:DUF3857 domain-containing protein [bacterium]